MKILPLILAVAVFFTASVSALDMSVNLDSDVIVRDYDNNLTGTVTIIGAEPGLYNLFSLSDIAVTPNEIFKITDAGNYSKEIRLSPLQNLDVIGTYTFQYTLNHREVEKITKKVSVKIREIEDIVEITSETVDQEKGIITLSIQNNEDVELKNVKVKLSSILFDTEAEIDLEPLKKSLIEVKVDKEKLEKTKAGVYVINAVFDTPKGEKETEGNLFLGEKKGIITSEDEAGFFIRTQTISKINSGNILENIEIKLEKNIFSRLFTSFNIPPTITKRDGLTVKYTWLKEKLGPTESYIVKAKTNYILPTLIIIFAIIVIIGIKRYSETKVEVSKLVEPVKTKNGEFALKIKLSVKSRKYVENAALIDKVPAIVKVYKKFGTQEPDKIDAENRRIHWNIGDLNAGEERVFSYIVYSKVGVVGKFSLPEALVVFESDGQIHEIESGKVFFMADQIKG